MREFQFPQHAIHKWRKLRDTNEVMYLLVDDPDFVREAMAIQADFAARLAERILQEAPVDAAIFSEPIGGNDNALISPQMYEALALTSYL